MKSRALPLYVTSVIILIGLVIFWLQFPNMFSTREIVNLLTDSAYPGIVAVGMPLVILSGCIDLLVGSVIAFQGMFLARDAAYLLSIEPVPIPHDFCQSLVGAYGLIP